MLAEPTLQVLGHCVEVKALLSNGQTVSPSIRAMFVVDTLSHVSSFGLSVDYEPQDVRRILDSSRAGTIPLSMPRFDAMASKGAV